ncbi:lipopolysaccharide transport periplasmic protein LptA [Aquimixticola soesokkakensis]|uniref:lipopolysaccharide transport periplasmic protein LptA n=1 Tax=Aquimixticola soesokkakensis TaxID=1519096 RepID=UPI000A26A7C9
MIRPLAVVAFLLLCSGAQAQQIAFGGLQQDPTAPVEVTADSLAVDQATGLATFSGNVLIGQGEMRMSAAQVVVVYGTTSEEIERLEASGGVTLATPSDAAEADSASYTIASGEVTLTGNVLVTQGANTIAAERMVIDLTAGTGRMDGRVKTTFTPSGAQ